jgi:flagellar assembly protein FliH
MIKLPTADEIDSMFEVARREGHALGYGEGRELGYQEGAAKAGEQASQLAALGSAFDEGLARIDGEIAEEITALAIEIARQVIRHSLADHPAAIVETVRTALQQLPQNQVAIQLHPDDAALVREYLADQLEHGRHQLIEDDTLSRGGCRVRAINCEIDATLETRWRRVLETIGRGDTTWEEPQR